jgi:hypothetical protein
MFMFLLAMGSGYMHNLQLKRYPAVVLDSWRSVLVLLDGARAKSGFSICEPSGNCCVVNCEL